MSEDIPKLKKKRRFGVGTSNINEFEVILAEEERLLLIRYKEKHLKSEMAFRRRFYFCEFTVAWSFQYPVLEFSDVFDAICRWKV